MAPFDNEDKVVSTRNHRASAVLACLITGATVPAITRETGVSERTIHRYLRDEKFIQAFKDAKKGILERAVLKLGDAVSDALDTLVEIHKDKIMPPASRATCAARIIQMAFEYGPVGELEQRLRQIEANRVITQTPEWK